MDKIKELIKKHYELISYVFFGGLTTVVSIVTYFLALAIMGQKLDTDDMFFATIANSISWVLAVSFAYITNKIFVFKTKDLGLKKTTIEVFMFAGARISSYFVEIFLFWLLATTLNFNGAVVKIFNQIIIILLNYILSKFVIFKKSK